MKPIFRSVLILLALVNLAVLGTRLWPWRDILTEKAPGIPPTVCLLVFSGVIFWAGGIHRTRIHRLLATASVMGALAGFLIVIVLVLTGNSISADLGFAMRYFYMGMLFFAGLLWWVASGFAADLGGNVGSNLLFGAWSGMVSSLVVSIAVLTGINFSLNDDIRIFDSFLTTFLMVPPLAGGALGLFSGLYDRRRKV